jgi:hypothetical protein
MTCTSGFEFLHRPYPYPREPFRLTPGELVGYEGRYFSSPAYGLLADKRLFTTPTDALITSPIKLYINTDAGISSGIEPTLTASGYEVATPHYADYILDMRELLEEVLALHAADSEYSSDDFFRSHMQRNRASYDIPNSSASGVSDLAYVHPAPANIVPVPPSSTTTPSNEIELGALQFQDIDLDEVMWQPFPRPKSPETGPNAIPTIPIFPAALPNGSLPSFSSLDEEKFGELGLNAPASGGVLLTGDGLVEGTSIKLLTGSGQPGASEGDYIQNVPWTLFPAETDLNRYYETENSGCITASGRQAIYDVPTGAQSNSVLLLDVSNAGSSGQLVQTYPANYHSTSGVDPSGLAHDGVHTVDKLLYSLSEISANNIAVGRSLLNGKKIFGHYVGSESSSQGLSVTSRLKYANGDIVYAYGGITVPRITNTTSQVEWATIGNALSPVSWGLSSTSALQPSRGIFGGPDSTTFDVGDIMAAADGVLWLKPYAKWGYLDKVVSPASDKAGGGSRTEGTINYETHLYKESINEAGEFEWVELDPSQSPVFTSQTAVYYSNTYHVNNIFSAFFFRRPNLGLVHVNGNVYFQWSEGDDGEATNSRFAAISTAPKSTTQVPPTARNVSIFVVGFFPSWKVLLAVTTNNQITVPGLMSISPPDSPTISFAPDLGITLADVDVFGPAVWDPSEGVNYLYFLTFDDRVFFAQMNTSFTVVNINQVSSTDAILTGRAAILSI